MKEKGSSPGDILNHGGLKPLPRFSDELNHDATQESLFLLNDAFDSSWIGKIETEESKKLAWGI